MLNAHGVEQDRLAETIAFMRKAEGIDLLSLCTLCGRHLQLLMLIPCGHMACADCVESRVERLGPSCGVCKASYDWEIFQMLQPGFEFSNVEETWDYDNTPTPDEVNAARNASGPTNGPNGQNSRRRRDRNDGSTIPVRERHGNRQRIIPIDLSRFVTVNASKAFYVASRIVELKKEFVRGDGHDASSYWHTAPSRPKVVKAIIFSQFKEHIWRVKVALAQQGIKCADFITGVSAVARMEGLLKFRNDPDSNVLVLTDVGSHGLDLSFVTHIFLMDEIWDKSLESQVVARAHRMGARHSVVVEQLLMRASVEEIMHEMNKRTDSGRNDDNDDGQEDDDEDDDHIVPQHTPGSRAMKGFFAGEKKHRHKRQKHRAGPSKSNQLDTNSKSSMQHRQLQMMLQSLRLIEETKVAEFGIVQFEVLDKDGACVRAASLRLPNPGKPPASMAQTVGDPPASATVSRMNPPPRSSPNASNSPAAPPRTVSSSMPPPSSKAPAKQKRVHIKAEVPSPKVKLPRSQSTVIDLTNSDGVTSTPSTNRVSTSHYGLFIASSEDIYDEVDDSETDDEWPPIKTESRAKKSTGKRKLQASPHVKGKGKRKLVRRMKEEDTKPSNGKRRVVVNDDDETDDEY